MAVNSAQCWRLSQAVYIYPNTVVRSRNHCCHAKKVLNIPNLCLYPYLNYPARKAHASFYIAVCCLSCCTVFFDHYKKVLILKYVLFCSLQLLSETFPTLRPIKHYTINVHRSSCKVFVILVEW
jgi:hypothetical protein